MERDVLAAVKAGAHGVVIGVGVPRFLLERGLALSAREIERERESLDPTAVSLLY